jgi:NAD(P)H-dependent FMN reductase
MITIIASTNRPDSMTEVVATHYLNLIKAKNSDAQIFSLKQLPRDFAFSELYGGRSEEMTALIEKYIEPAAKMVFIIPEYHGSYPGILKTFFDGISAKFFREKKAGIIGISDGHAGNLRGQEHLMGVLQHMKMFVHYAQPKLSMIDKLVNEQNEITDERALKLLNDHADFMTNF